tara:strand:+ start:151 stop:1002 length:852 start_codon:yes stop_codon:yes gene_type:complete
MGWKKLLGDAKGKFDEYAEKKRFEKSEREREIAEEERVFRKYQKEVNDLLLKFEIKDLQGLLKNILNVKIDDIFVEYEKGEGGYNRKPERSDFIDRIWEYLHEGSLHKDQIIDFSLKNKIVAPSFFGLENAVASNERDFENIINSIKVDFQPEKIKDEKELQSQLTIFIKAKFPDVKVEREVLSKTGDKLDLVIDDKYVFELKVPKTRNTLRDLSAQLEEYSESYPNLCAVIADISEEENLIDEEGNTLVTDARLSAHIKDYADKYRRKYSVDTIILNTGMRK